MTVTKDDFNKIWASTSSVPTYTFSDTDYKNGWEFVGNLPPTRAMWDEIQRKNDEKMQLLYTNASFWVDSVADLRTADAGVGTVYATKGYYTPNDGGAGTYSIRGKAAGETEDGGSVIFLANGNVAELIIENDTVNVLQFGSIPNDNTVNNHDAFYNAINAAGIVDLVGKKFEIKTEVYINSDVTIRNGEIHSPSSAGAYSGAFTAQLGSVAEKITFRNIKFTSIRDQTPVTFTDTELSSNVMFFSSANVNLSVEFDNCDIAQCEYVVKKNDKTALPLIIKNCKFYDSMMPVYTNGHGVLISDSFIECVATSQYYHATYFSFHGYEDGNVVLSNSVFKNTNQNSGVSVNIASDALAQKLRVVVDRCQLIDGTTTSAAGGIGTAYTDLVVSNSRCNIGFSGTYTNCDIQCTQNLPKRKIICYGCTIHTEDSNGMIVTNDGAVVEFIDCKFTGNRDTNDPLIYLAGSALMRIINSEIDSSSLRVTARLLTSSKLELINNYISRDYSNTYTYIYATDSATFETYNNVCKLTDNSNVFDSANGNIVIPNT